MNDQAAWDQALASARGCYTNLPNETARALDGLIEQILQLKQNLVDLVLAAGSADICRACGGDCCRFGKYHVSILDILAYLKSGATLIVPDFSSTPYCPYSDAAGCTMAPAYRPMTCVVFNCQQVEDRLTPGQQESLHACEQELRDTITRAGQLTGMRLDRALLLSAH